MRFGYAAFCWCSRLCPIYVYSVTTYCCCTIYSSATTSVLYNVYGTRVYCCVSVLFARYVPLTSYIVVGVYNIIYVCVVLLASKHVSNSNTTQEYLPRECVLSSHIYVSILDVTLTAVL